MTGAADRAFVALQRLLPQHGISRLVGHLADARQPWIKNPFIRLFTRIYQVDLSEAEYPDPADYPSFNAFFTRALKPGARPLAGDENTVISPADGTLSQAGPIRAGQLLQAKGHQYALEALLGGDPAFLNPDTFEGGSFATIYLAPQDYHRVHAPLAGRLVASRAIPGALFSVNAATEALVEGLFARNERLVCHFETSLGPVAVVLVGALIVAGIRTVWPGPRSPYRHPETIRHDGPRFARGDEIGAFFLASTVIVCLPAGANATLAPARLPGSRLRMGEALFQIEP